MTLREPQDGASSETPVSAEPQPGVEQYRAAVRRAPKLAVFLVLGGLLGVIVAFILTGVHGAEATQSGDSTISDNGLWIAVVFFFSIAVGVAVGGIVALILDRLSHRRVAIVMVERGVVEGERDEDAALSEEAREEDAAEPDDDATVPTEAPMNEGAPAGSELTENSSPDVGGRA